MEGSRALFGRGLGRDLEALGASWVVLGSPFFKLVFGVVVKSALGGTSAGLWLDFQGFGEDFGRVLGGVWRLLALLGRRQIDIKNESEKREFYSCGLGAKSAQDPPPKVLLGAPGLDFGSILKGLNRTF